MTDDISSLLPKDCNSPEETISLGEEISLGLSAGMVVALSGELGTGKTHFTKGLCKRFIGNEMKVTSPTFTLVNEYSGSIPIYHFDFYRLESIDELFDIGFDEYLDGGGICIIEWPDKFPDAIPEGSLYIDLEHWGSRGRKISLRSG